MDGEMSINEWEAKGTLSSNLLYLYHVIIHILPKIPRMKEKRNKGEKGGVAYS